MTSITLSILVSTVPSRLPFYYPRIMKSLLNQVGDRKDIEIIGLFDNKIRSVGAKRDALLQLASGKFLTFIDDDDRIEDCYIENIMNTIATDPDADCIVYNVLCSVNGAKPFLCKYGIEFSYGKIKGGTEWRGKPAHTMVWRSSLAKLHRFSDMKHGEDVDWVLRAITGIKKQVRIDKVLYHYDANYRTTSETALCLSDKIIKTHSGLDAFLSK